jgi:hypothetical protein
MSGAPPDGFYVYVHRTQDLGGIFYVGKGKRSRAVEIRKRSKLWDNIVAKHGGFSHEIVARFDAEEEAFAHERFLIAGLRVTGVRLANLTDGGDGPSGYRHTPETKAKISAMFKGRVLSQDTRQKMSASRVGVPKSEAHIKSLTGRVFSLEHRMRLRGPKDKASQKAKREAYVARLPDVLCVDLGLKFDSVAAAKAWLRENGFPRAATSAISEHCRGLRSVAYGYQWRYVPKEPK